MGNMRDLVFGSIAVVILFAIWVLAVNIGNQMGDGMAEWLVR